MQFLQHGLSFYYTDSHPGDLARPALVLIHGFPHTHELWTPQVQALGKEFRIITWDLRGFGGSTGGDGHLMIEFFVDDLMGLIDHLKLQRPSIGGLSMGGYIALRAVERHPDRFTALILANTGAEADSNTGKTRRAESIRKIREQGFDKFVADFGDNVFQPETLARDPGTRSRFDAMIARNSPSSVIAGLIALAARLDMTGSLDQIRVPTLILAGDRDQVTPVRLSEFMRDRIPGAQLVVLPRAGHLSNWEATDGFNEAVQSFMREHAKAVG